MKYVDVMSGISLDNKYTRWYLKIITRALDRQPPTGYTEKHHILPKSFNLGGEKDLQNIVSLTAREHFVCHWLLTKMFTKKSLYGQKMIRALSWLSTGTKAQTRYSTAVTSSVFERNKIKVTALKSERESKKVSIDGKVYNSFKEANRQTKIPNLFRKLSDERYPEYFFIDEPDRKTTQVTREWRFSVTINGIQYKSVSEAARKLNMKRCEIDARLRDPNDTAFVSSEITADKERTLKESLKKKVVAEGLLFSSMTDAMKTLNLRRDTLKYRLRGNAFRDYYYV